MIGSRLERYAFINAKLKTRLSALLPDEFFHRIMRSPTLNEAVQLLRDTDYASVGQGYETTGDLKLGELELFSLEAELYRGIKKMLSGDLLDFLDALFRRLEIDNLKAALRLWLDRNIRRRDISSPLGYLYRGKLVDDFDLGKVVQASDPQALVQTLAGTPYAEIVSAAADTITGSASLFVLETALDRFYYRGVYEAAQQLDPEDRKIVARIAGIDIDLQNLGRIFRFSSFYQMKPAELGAHLIPGGLKLSPDAVLAAWPGQENRQIPEAVTAGYPEIGALVSGKGEDPTSRLLLIEGLLQQILNREISRLLAGYPFTVGIMLAYFSLKHREIRRLCAVLNAKSYGMGEESMGDFL